MKFWEQRMDKYYYLVAQLPLLHFDKETNITTLSFIEEAEKWLGKRDFHLLKQARFESASLYLKSPKVLGIYNEFEFNFRNDLTKWRLAAKEGQEYKPQTFSISLIKDNNPLHVEKNLLAFRWKFIEQLEADHHFDLAYLILYYYKLQILEKLSLFNKEKGLEIFQKISKVSE